MKYDLIIVKKIPLRHINTTLKEPVSSGHLVIWNLIDLLSGKDMVQELHRHSFYFILVLKNGRGSHIVDFISYPVGDSQVFIMKPGQVHELELDKTCTGFLLQFPEDYFMQLDIAARQILKKACRKVYYITSKESLKNILSFMRSIVDEISGNKSNYEYAIRINLQLFFIELLRQEYPLNEEPKKKNTYALEKVEAFQGLIADNFSSHKEVSWYADKMNITTYQLNTFTKKTLGKTSTSVINDYILLEAKRYLMATANQVNQISWHLGYEDVSYFIRFFKKHTGYPPEVFRQNFK